MSKESNFPEYLKNIRTAAGFSQREVSEQLGYTTSQFISNWERGLSTPPPKVVKKLASMYGVSLEHFLELLLQDTLKRVKADFREKIKGIL